METPTTAEVPLESAVTSDIFSPHNEGDTLDQNSRSEKEFLSTSGFNFSIIEDEPVEIEVIGDNQTEGTSENSPSKSSYSELKGVRPSFINLIDGTYNLDEFDPFGVKTLTKYSRDHFTSRMNLGESCSSYTHPAVIMEEVRKPPYTNIFASHFGPEDEEQKTNCDNIATLTACLQRSVMLPLTYQLEVVNNSILTYFLVNLDMYEHLRSLKDYFFLMDGEFSKSICQNLFSRLVKTLNPQDLLNFATLHNILDKALGSSISRKNCFP